VPAISGTVHYSTRPDTVDLDCVACDKLLELLTFNLTAGDTVDILYVFFIYCIWIFRGPEILSVLFFLCRPSQRTAGDAVSQYYNLQYLGTNIPPQTAELPNPRTPGNQRDAIFSMESCRYILNTFSVAAERFMSFFCCWYSRWYSRPALWSRGHSVFLAQ
jgi:hypothetical protein